MHYAEAITISDGCISLASNNDGLFSITPMPKQNPLDMFDPTTTYYDVPDQPFVMRKIGNVWYARFIMPGVKTCDRGRIERTTRKTELLEAIPIAMKILNHFETKIDRGEHIRSSTVTEVAKAFLSDIAEQGRNDEKLAWKHERYETALVQKWLPFIGDKQIDEIDDLDMVKQRRSRIKDGNPRAGTLRKERQILNELFDFAVLHKFLKRDQIPKVPTIKGDYVPRGFFEPDEMELIQMGVHLDWQLTKHRLHRRNKGLLYFRILLIYLTGLRPQEASRIRFGQLRKGVDVLGQESFNIQLEVWQCKHPSHARRVVPLQYFKDYVEQLKAFYRESDDREVADDDYLIHDQDRQPIFKRHHALRRALRQVGLDPTDRPYYAFRHTFATERLIENISRDSVSKWMRTSHEMLNDYYDHAEANFEFLSGSRMKYSPTVLYLTPTAKQITNYEDLSRDELIRLIQQKETMPYQ